MGTSLKAFGAAIAFGAIVGLMPPTSASAACGFVACVVDHFIPGSAPILDGVHERLGKPLERPIGRPASVASDPNAPSEMSNPSSPPPRVLPMPPGTQFGAFCATRVGVFGPGRVQPVGMPCHAGPYWGEIVS
jgi:hypothetical protein